MKLGVSNQPMDRLLYPTLLVLALLAVGLQLGGGDVLTKLAFQTFIFIAMAASYDLFSGYTGYYNLGYGSFFAVGGYTFVLTFERGLPLLVAVALSGIFAGLFALAVSYPFFRLRGAYFAIGTFGLVQLLFVGAVNLSDFTGGLPGKYVRLADVGIPPESIVIPLYYAAVVLALATTYVHYRLGRSKLGLALQTLREDESVAENFGINAFRAKTKALVLSSFFAGLAGSVFVLNIQFVNALFLLGLEVSLAPVVMAILGGSGLFLGPAVGALIFSVIRELLLTSFFGLQLLGFGAILLFIGLFAPGGLLRLRWLRRVLQTRAWPS